MFNWISILKTAFNLHFLSEYCIQLAIATNLEQLSVFFSRRYAVKVQTTLVGIRSSGSIIGRFRYKMEPTDPTHCRCWWIRRNATTSAVNCRTDPGVGFCANVLLKRESNINNVIGQWYLYTFLSRLICSRSIFSRLIQNLFCAKIRWRHLTCCPNNAMPLLPDVSSFITVQSC